MINYYEVLEVNERASQEVIRMAYKALARKYHPDLSSHSDSSTKMKVINDAYEVLGNPIKREKYDEVLKNMRIKNKYNSFNGDKRRKTDFNSKKNGKYYEGKKEYEYYKRKSMGVISIIFSVAGQVIADFYKWIYEEVAGSTNDEEDDHSSINKAIESDQYTSKFGFFNIFILFLVFSVLVVFILLIIDDLKNNPNHITTLVYQDLV